MEAGVNDRRKRAFEVLVFLFLAWLCVGSGNWLRGAFDSGLGSFDDEPSHVVTGLLVADYLVADDQSDPMAFAKRYYLHYPKVALGQWPPVFYVLIAGWVRTFGETIPSLMSLMTTLTTLCGLLVYLTLRREYDRGLAAVFALLFLFVPVVQKLGSSVMAEVPMALLGFGATLCFAQFLRTERLRPLFAFGVLAVATILTKGNGLALVVVPLIAIALSGRWKVLRRPALWGVAFLIGAVTMPWYVWTLSTAAGTWEGGSSPSANYVLESTSFHLSGLFVAGGVCLGMLGIIGFVSRPTEDSSRITWSACIAWIVGVLTIHALVPSSIEVRHQVLMLPAWLVLAGRGFAVLREWIDAPRLRLAALCAVPLLFAVQGFSLPVRQNMGFRSAANDLLTDPGLEQSVFLIASDPIGEGLFITAIALAEVRPGHVVLRGTKVLAQSDWMGRDYRLRYDNEAGLGQFLSEVPVGVVVIDHSCPKRRLLKHQVQLYAHVRRRQDLWKRVGSYDVERDGVLMRGGLELWRQRRHEERVPMVLDPDWVLGRALPSAPRFLRQTPIR